MKRISLTLGLVGCMAIIVSVARAQMPPPPTNQTVAPVELVPVEQTSRNRVQISYQMGLNITANFRNLGGFAAQSNPGPATGTAVNRTYDNGYNLVDVSGNAGGQTWYWGYTDSSSLQGNRLVLDSSSSLANGISRDNSSDPQHGFEIALNHELYRHPSRDWRLGIQGAFGYTRVSITDNRTLFATVRRVSDAYAIPAGVVVPQAPYAGTSEGPGPVIGSEPVSRSTTDLVDGAIISGERTLDANVFGFRLGPYLEMPLTDRFALIFGGGLFLAVADSNFKFRETVTIPDVGTQTYSGSGGQTDVLVGGYVGANLQYALTEEVGLLVGARFQGAGRSVTRDQGRQAILNLNESVIVSIGASYSF